MKSILILALFFTLTVNIFSQSDCASLQNISSENNKFGCLVANPAYINADASFFVSCPNISAFAGNNMMNLSDFNYYFGGVKTNENGVSQTVGRTLTINERNSLASLINNGSSIINARVSPLALIYSSPNLGSVALSVNYISESQAILPTNIDKLIKGYLGSTSLSFSDAKASSITYSTYQLDYSNRLINFSDNTLKSIDFGIGVKYVEGYYFANLKSGSKAIINPFAPEGCDSLRSWDIKMNYESEYAGAKNVSIGNPAGSGEAFDLGLKFNFNEKDFIFKSMGFSINDLGSINWKTNVKKETINVRDTINAIAQMTEDEFKQYEAKRENISSFDSQTPARIYANIEINAPKLFALDLPLFSSIYILEGLNEIGSNTTNPIAGYSIGISPIGLVPGAVLGVKLGGDLPPVYNIELNSNISNFFYINLGVETSNFAFNVKHEKQFAIYFNAFYKVF